MRRNSGSWQRRTAKADRCRLEPPAPHHVPGKRIPMRTGPWTLAAAVIGVAVGSVLLALPENPQNRQNLENLQNPQNLQNLQIPQLPQNTNRPDPQDPPKQPNPTPQRPVFRAGAVLVTVDAYPQHDGQIVEGLTPEDFEVFEDDKSQKVETFDFVRVEPARSEDERRDPNNVREANAQAADPRNR